MGPLGRTDCELRRYPVRTLGRRFSLSERIKEQVVRPTTNGMPRSHMNWLTEKHSRRRTLVTGVLVACTAACVRHPAERDAGGTTTARPALHVQPETVQVDVPAHTWISGLAPRQRATVISTLRFDSTQVLAGQAIFRADEHGRIDLTRQSPDSGTYAGGAPRGLVWSGRPNTLSAEQDRQH